MAGLIPKSFIDDLVGRADIVELIGSRVPLKKAGREFKACCPFHDEKTPSFHVIPDKQFYHCFGCGAHGTAIGFLMNYDHLPFVEAVEELASRLGLEVPREAGPGGPVRGVDDDLYAVTREVAEHYARELARNAHAAEYARRRGLEPATLERFQLGYAGPSWNDVLNRFGKDDAARRRLADTGLIIEKGAATGRGDEPRDRWFDRFRDRLMFPIRDVRGRIIGFGGRVIDQGEPKYMNSPETTLFHKGRELYGLHEVRQSRAPLKRLLIVEGYMDVVRLHQAGIGYAVATLGTATTAEHLARAFRMVSEVIFSFDGDRAGRAAAWRALQNVLPEARAGREIRFLFLPDGEDPDSLVGREGAAAFEARIATESVSLADYFIQQLRAEVDLTETGSKAKLVAVAYPLIERVPPGVFCELLKDAVASAIQVKKERFDELFEAAATTARSSTRQEDREPTSSPHARIAAGRGGVVRQSVQHLVHFPAISRRVSDALREGLAAVDKPGVTLLRALLDDLARHPVSHQAQLLERWRDSADYASLLRLAMSPSIAPDEPAAAVEFLQGLTKMIGEAGQARLNQLIEKADGAFLSAEEKQELQRLTTLQTPAAPPSRPGAPPKH